MQDWKINQISDNNNDKLGLAFVLYWRLWEKAQKMGSYMCRVRCLSLPVLSNIEGILHPPQALGIARSGPRRGWESVCPSCQRRHCSGSTICGLCPVSWAKMSRKRPKNYLSRQWGPMWEASIGALHCVEHSLERHTLDIKQTYSIPTHRQHSDEK